MEDALYEKRIPRSSSIYRQLAEKVGLTTCGMHRSSASPNHSEVGFLQNEGKDTANRRCTDRYGPPNFTETGSEKSSDKIIALIRNNPKLSAREIAGRIGISPRAVEKQIAASKKGGRLRGIGPAKGGYWELIE